MRDGLRAGAHGGDDAFRGGMTAGAVRKTLDQRQLVPELLDALPPDDVRARRSRADLRRINLIMRRTGIADAMIRRRLDVPQDGSLRLLELGAGDGHAMLRLARRMARRHTAARLTLLDLAPAISEKTLEEFAALDWRVEVVTAEALDWLATTEKRFDLALANLFLHHFEPVALRRLMRALAPRAELLVATEPLRTMTSLVGAGLVGLIGANGVTRHDAPASVRAGFRGAELGAQWSPHCGVVLEEVARFPFTHAFVGRSHGSVPREAPA